MEGLTGTAAHAATIAEDLQERHEGCEIKRPRPPQRQSIASEARADFIHCAEMEEPWENLPMGIDCCTGIRGICAGAVALMDAMLPVARTTDYDE